MSKHTSYSAESTPEWSRKIAEDLARAWNERGRREQRQEREKRSTVKSVLYPDGSRMDCVDGKPVRIVEARSRYRSGRTR